LTRRLLEDLDERTQLPTDRCLELGLLEQFAGGSVGSVDRERVEAHLGDCLVCLDRFVELRDHLRGIAAPERVSPHLARTLDTLIGRVPKRRLWSRIAETLRRALVFRVPAWAVAAMAAVMVITWVAAYKTQRPDTAIQWPVDFSSPGKLTPTRGQVPRTVSGVVSSLRDATANGVEAHVVSLKDTAGATYILFAWGQPTVRLGDSVEVDGIFASDVTQNAGLPVYQGVATQLRRVR
jgi:hypothetical protein